MIIQSHKFVFNCNQYGPTMGIIAAEQEKDGPACTLIRFEAGFDLMDTAHLITRNITGAVKS